jgi:hypothetical protein
MDSGWELERIWKDLGRLGTGCQEACGVQRYLSHWWEIWTCVGHVLDAPGM